MSHSFSLPGTNAWILHNGDFSGDATIHGEDGFVATVPCELLLKFGLQIWADKMTSGVENLVDSLWKDKPDPIPATVIPGITPSWESDR